MFQKHQRSCAVHRWQKSRRRRNKILFLLEIDLLAFTHFPISSSPGAVNLLSEELFDSWLKQTRGTEQQDLVKAFSSLTPCGRPVLARPRDHTADYLCRLWSFPHQIYLPLLCQWCVCSEFVSLPAPCATVACFFFFGFYCVSACLLLSKATKHNSFLMRKTPARNEMELLSKRVPVGLKFRECVFAAVFPPKQ